MAEKIIAERYILKRELGAGGMGTVYLGEDTRYQQILAIKELHSNLADEELITRFKREGEALRDLNHPNIVKMLDAVEENGRHYLIMEYIAGADLAKILKNRQLSLEQIINSAIDLADALTRAHHLHIIHRDLKPANILIGEDDVLRLTDFGVAHIGSKVRVTGTNAIIGTIDYLPPEAFDGGQFDERGDIWAFGVILFEMLAGKRPFEGDSVIQVIQAISSATIPNLEELRSGIPVDLIDLVYRMLERDPISRISSVRHVGAVLEDLQKGRSSTPLALGSRFDTPISSSRYIKKDNLPLATIAFVGREAELTELSRILHSQNNRLITILAPGGMGKTSLSIELGRRELESFEDGVYFIELAALSNPNSIVTTIADVCGFQFADDKRSPKQQLLDLLADRKMLLILDNFEHLVDGAGIVDDILKIAPNVKMVVTSRQALKVSGETLFHLSGMDFPDWESPEDALDYAAMKLFMNSAVRALPSFTLSQENLDYIARICRLVQGMPLGIVLAASWLAMLSPEEIAAEMQKSIDILEDETGHVPARQRSIRAVMNYSWDMMNEAEQESFMKLSVFRGGFTRESAEAIASANLRLLMSLVTKSLIRRETESGRYLIHELLRQYAEEKLQSQGDAVAVYASYSGYYLDFLAKSVQGIKGGDKQFKILDDIAADFDNIQAAWQAAVRNNDFERVNAALEGLELFCNLRSHFRDAEMLFDYARQASLPDALGERVKIRYSKSGRDAAVLEEALKKAEARADELEMAWCYDKLGFLAHNVQQDDAQAVNCFEEAANIYRKLGEMYYLSETLMRLSEAYQGLGNYQKSVPLVQEAHEIQEANQNKLGLAKTQRVMSQDLLMRGEFDAMWVALRTCYELFVHAKNLAGQAEGLLFIGWNDLFTGGEPHGEKRIELARQLAKDIGLVTTFTWSTAMLSVYHLVFGELAEGERWLADAEASETDPLQQAGAGSVFLTLLIGWSKCLVALRKGDTALCWQMLKPILSQVYQMHALSVFGDILPNLTVLWTQERKYERAVENLGVLEAFLPEKYRWYYNWSMHQEAEKTLRQSLDEDHYIAALERGKSMELMVAVKLILDGLNFEVS
jgi:serine/threonine protein kinase/tetratricopeptide (TPR) repeat protein